MRKTIDQIEPEEIKIVEQTSRAKIRPPMNETPPKPVNSATSKMMSDAFPIQIPDRLPTRIAPCPIVEAIFEGRFVSPELWATMPGLLYAD